MATTPNLRLEPILLKGPIVAVSLESVKRPMRSWQSKTVRRMKQYPPQKPTVSGYVRQGARGLGGGWTFEGPTRQGNDLVSTVGNNVAHAPYVQGPAEGPKGFRQTKEMASRDWQRIDEEAAKVWDETIPEIDRALAGK